MSRRRRVPRPFLGARGAWDAFRRQLRSRWRPRLRRTARALATLNLQTSRGPSWAVIWRTRPRRFSPSPSARRWSSG
eukprot:11168558-Lingulodinium_polyedra.AAC.1